MNRDLAKDFAWDAFIIKSIDEEQRIIEGIASTPSVRSHRRYRRPERRGIQAAAELPLAARRQDAARARHRGQGHRRRDLDQGEDLERPRALHRRKMAAHQSGLVNSLSIGFRSLEAEPIKDSKTFGVRFKQWEWLELSAVTIPANQDASILSIKALDYGHQRAALGTASNVVRLGTLSPGASGKNAGMALEGHQVKTTAERDNRISRTCARRSSGA